MIDAEKVNKLIIHITEIFTFLTIIFPFMTKKFTKKAECHFHYL